MTGKISINPLTPVTSSTAC